MSATAGAPLPSARIGIDFLPALTHPPGVGRYARELVRALVALEDRPDLALCELGPGERLYSPRDLGFLFGDPRVARTSGSTSRRFLRIQQRLLRGGIDRRLGGVDLFHHVIPGALRVASAKQTIAIASLPEEGTHAAGELARELARMDAVIAFSDDVRRRLVARFSVRPERAHQVHVGCEHWRRALPELPPRDVPPRIVVLGAVRRTRRPIVVLRAFEKLVQGGIDARLEYLALPPPRGARPDPAAVELEQVLHESSARPRVLWRGPSDVEDAPRDPLAFEKSLPARVASAAVLVHLSDDEGTAVTPLEALSLGLPVVASRIPAFEEALGDAAVLVDPAASLREPEVVADALARALLSAGDAHAESARLLTAREYSWERCARETLGVWRRVLESG